MSTPPGGQRTVAKRAKAQASKGKADAKQPENQQGGNSILKIYSDEANGLRVDPLVIIFLAVGFIFSVVALHIIAKFTSKIF
ncbi:hypothetical protein TPHA_0F03120 [Tetrapisispora phaffii CBS 4417]|uniref:Protein transport protein Sec61 subunit beta n=1 Tax=Tetrapisispora phaffii (strain ATCC 24235 / CBS 4417 / NBRC 1672 / NRRL Y-8282 / UCD 70-5) TaxID=1071381 RepID=G8BUK7_TETPH|nr:hypothetical protein TPHA_0F03120 [Tetrapisispora phaffii CBS 4417]CCE63793.1 hypothetical protein TPHA_0F03120 [Tetrapisispora phaffii CBS 4417]